MRSFDSMADFGVASEGAGLGALSSDELLLLKLFYDGAVAVSERIAAALRDEDQPATTFRADWIDPVVDAVASSVHR